MVKLNCSTVGGVIRFICLIALGGIVTWPVWAITFSGVHYRVLDLLPFALNALSLLGHSYEAESLDWRIWGFNMMTGGALSLASFLGYHGEFDPAGISIIALATLVSFIGSLTEIHNGHKATGDYGKGVALVKVSFIVVVCGLVMWGILWWQGTSAYTFLSQLLIGGSVACASIVSLLFTRGREERKKFGLGSPLLWLFVRILLTAGVNCFWLWAAMCLASFSVINFHHKRVGLIGALTSHWHAWQRIERFSSGVTLIGSVALVLLVLNGRTATITTQPDYPTLRISEELKVDFGMEFNCTNIASMVWRSFALEGLNRSRNVAIESTYFPREFEREHRMFEESASVVVVTLLLVNSAAGYLRKLKDPQATQGFWQPIFFFVAGMMVFVVSLEPRETLGYVSNWLSVSWADDSVMAFSLSMFLFIFSFSVSAFSYDRGELKRTSTPFSSFRVERFRRAGTVVLILSVAISFLCFAQAFRLFERERPVSVTIGELSPGVYEDPENTSSIVMVYRLEPFIGEASRELLTADGMNCSDPTACRAALLSADGSNPCPMDYEAVNKVSNHLVSGDWRRRVEFGLSDLLDKEILAQAVLSLCTTIVIAGGLMFPILDDLSLVLTGVSSVLMTVVVPYRIREVLEFGTPREWFVPILALVQFLAGCATLFVRVESPRKFVNPWSTVAQLEMDMAFSAFEDYGEFVRSITKKPVSGKTSEEVFTELEKLEEEGEERELSVSMRRGSVEAS